MAWIPMAINAYSAIRGMGESNAATANANRLSGLQEALYGMQGQLGQQYLPWYMREKKNLYENPLNNPLYRMMMNNMKSGIQGDYNLNMPSYLMNNSLRGGGKPGTSSVANNLMLQLAKAKGDMMAKGGLGIGVDFLNRGYGALDSIGPMAERLTSSAAGGYGDMATNAQQTASQYGPALQKLMSSIFAGSGGGGGLPNIPVGNDTEEFSGVFGTGIPDRFSTPNVTTTTNPQYLPWYMRKKNLYENPLNNPYELALSD